MHNLYRDPQHQTEVAARKVKLRELANHCQDTEVVEKLDAKNNAAEPGKPSL